MTQQQALSSKEASLFRQVVKNYESKQHKKGIKAADQILRKNPKHGDTQAMKALILNGMGQSEEAFVLAKEALTNALKSHVAWHVYGLLWRSKKNYDEAIRAYKFALKLEPDSQQIQRDLALLQIQMRDYQGYIVSRRSMLNANTGLRQNWTALAIALHLGGNLLGAENVLKTYEDTLKTPPTKMSIEHSEAALYRNRIIAEMGETERALEHLETIAKTNLDVTAVKEMRAQYLLDLNRHKDAETAYRDLLARNAEYRAYYEGLEKALSLDRKANKTELKELYGSYAQRHERIDAARRIPLDFLEGDDFRQAADQYLRGMLTKGVPSTFSNVKSLYGNKTKRDIIQELVESYQHQPVTNGNAEKHDAGGKFEESTLYFLALHYNYKLSRDLNKASSYVEKLIERSPKTYDYHMAKARISKHQGNTQEAARIMNFARELDLRDRYINTKCAKYQLRNEENEVALETMSKFTRNEVVGGTLGDLTDMQALWYLTEDGESNARQGKRGVALKRFHTIFNIFETWNEDQFDFHTFSLRKAQIRAYIDMIRWEDHLQDHPFYVRVAVDAVKIYLELYDTPRLAEIDGLPNGFVGDDKAVKRARKDLEKVEADRKEADRKAAVKKGNTGADGEVKKVDEDPRGKKLVETKEPLQEATKFLTPLLEFSEGSIEAQHVGFEVYIRRSRLFLALRCLLAAFKADSSHPTTHAQAIRFLVALRATAAESQLTPTLLELAKTKLPESYNNPSTPIATLTTELLSSNPDDASHVFAYVRVRVQLGESSSSKDAEAVLKTFDHCKDIQLTDAVEGVKVLKELKADKAILEAYLKRAKEIWPEASIIQRQMYSAGF